MFVRFAVVYIKRIKNLSPSLHVLSVCQIYSGSNNHLVMYIQKNVNHLYFI